MSGQTQSDCRQVLDEIIRREGSTFTQHPDDKGGATKYGITQRAWAAFIKESPQQLPDHVRLINEEHARGFYLLEHVAPFLWIEHRALQSLAIDSSVNHGRQRTIQWLQTAASVHADGVVGPITTQAVNRQPNTCYRRLLIRRFICYANLVADDETQRVFLRGWINRICEFVR